MARRAVSAIINAIISGVIDREKLIYTNRPEDSGGPTKGGITRATLARWRGKPVCAADVETLEEPEIRAIYYARYVTEPGFDRVVALSLPIAAELVDTGVNMGPPVATIFLQRTLNAFNLNGTKYPDIAVDGQCGDNTLRALNAFLSWRTEEGERVLLKAINCLQGEKYIDLAEKRPKDEANVYGWMRTRIAA
jgi:lysozyme family protein